MQRSCRIGADIFDVHFFTSAQIRFTKINIHQNRIHYPSPNASLQHKVQEARSSNLNTGNSIILSQLCRQRLCNITRLQTRIFSQYHRRIRCHVAMGCISRRVDCDVSKVQSSRQKIVFGKCFQTVDNSCANIGEQVHGNSFLQNAGLAPSNPTSTILNRLAS